MIRRHQQSGFVPRITLALLLLLAVGASNPPARGAELLVNGEFENPHADASWKVAPGGVYTNVAPVGWQGIGWFGVQQPTSIAFPGGIPEGTQTGFIGNELGNGILFQDVPAFLTAGDTYTLSIEVGSRLDYAGAGIVSLRTTSGAVLASSGAVSPAPGAFEYVELTYTVLPTDPLLGAQLRVQLERASGMQANFDAASLAVVSVPEPSSVALAAIGGLSLLIAFRRSCKRSRLHLAIKRTRHKENTQ